MRQIKLNLYKRIRVCLLILIRVIVKVLLSLTLMRELDSDVAVRKAIGYGFNAQEYIDNYYQIDGMAYKPVLLEILFL